LISRAQGGVANQPYWSFETDARVTVVEAADLDGDGLPEVAIGTADNQLYILENDGGLVWRYEAGGAISAIVLTDLDGDGRAQVVVGSADGEVSHLSDAGKLTWTFRAAGTASVGGTVWAVLPCLTMADLDGDGQVELLAGSYDGHVYALNGNGQERWSFDAGRPVLGIWVGDLDADGRPEIVPNPHRGGELHALENDGYLAWQQHTRGEVGQVQGGDVDGDGQAELVLLSASWDLFVYRGDGTLTWHSDAIALSHAHDTPELGQLLVRDLDGDGRAEMVVVAMGPRSTVYAFQDGGSQMWSHTLDTGGNATRLVAHDVDGDGSLEIAVTTPVYEPVYLLDSGGRLLAEYRTWGTSGSLEFADLDGDGRDEVLVATELGLQVFGTSDRVERRQLWRSPSLGPVAALAHGDTDGDGRGEVLAGSQSGQVYALTADGQILWHVPLRAAVLSLDAGDVDGDGRDELVVGTWGGAGSAGGNVHLLDGGHRLWSAPAGQYVAAVAMVSHRPSESHGSSEVWIVVGVGLASGGEVLRLDSDGEVIWRQALDERVTAVGGDGRQILVGTQGGRVYHLAADGSIQNEHKLGSAVIGIGEVRATTAGGHVYELNGHTPVLVQELEQPSKAIYAGTEGVTYALAEGKIGHLPYDGPIWQGTVDGDVTVLDTGDLDGDTSVELAVGTSRGRVYLFGLAVNQPPLLTRPGVAETRSGYAYGVAVNDPEGDTVTATLEVWDPSAGQWLVQPAQPLASGHGRLSWEVRKPFDTWDAGRDSNYRFAYDDGRNRGTVAAAPGPLSIPVDPWYIHYGRYAGGLVLLVLIASPLALYARRVRTHRRSPVGRAEAALGRLRPADEDFLLMLHGLVTDEDWAATILPYLPGLARDAGETTLADLAEGYYLVLTRPDAPRTAEGLRLLMAALAQAKDLVWAKEVWNLYAGCLDALEASTVSHIVALRSPLRGLGAALDNPEFFLANTAQALAGLAGVGDALRHQERVGMPEDKVVYLAQAAQTLGGYDVQFLTALARPERSILGGIAGSWLQVISRTAQEIQGRAQLEVALQTQQAVAAGDVVLGLELRNVGRSPATHVRVEALPGRGYGVVQGQTMLEQLPARRTEWVELIVRPTVSDQFRAEFEIRYDDQGGAGKVQHFADRVRLVAIPEEFVEIPNPYATGRPLGPGSPVFFGRDDLFAFVRENLGGGGEENILVLVGQRRMGKTSLLRQLPAYLNERYVPVFLDAQALGLEGGMAGLLYDIALEIGEAVGEQVTTIQQPSWEEMVDRPVFAFERQFLPKVVDALDGRTLLLLFDEFEEVEARVQGGELPATVFSFLRHLMQHSRNMTFLFAGTHRLEDLSADYWSILFNIALYRRVSTLDPAAARRLIIEPVQGYGVVYDDLAVEKMLRVTGGHPYFLQLLCHALVNLHNRERRNYLTIEDVNRTLAEIVGLGEAHLAFLWGGSSPEEQAVLLALARLLSAGEPGSRGAVTVLLAEHGLELNRVQVSEAIRCLVRREILRQAEPGADSHGFVVDLVRMWIDETQSLGRVLEQI
jgi:hypothetical protein